MRAIKIERSITQREENSLNRYLNELDKVELLSAEEEIILAQKIRSGDAAALERLVKCNLRFVVSVAKKYQHLGMSLSDLISEGNMGLMRAAKLFDEKRGFKFISYAVWWIRQAMMAALGSDVRMIRLPMNMVRATSDIRKAAEGLEQQLERVPTDEEISELLYVPNFNLAFGYAYGRSVVSLDGPARADGDGDGDLASVLMDREAILPDADLMAESVSLEARRMLSMLDGRERAIVEGSFGLSGREKSLEEIALELGLTRERVRQLKLGALGKLRLRLSKKNVVNG
jgi:RNA polymerase primary sigma factor